MPPPRTIDIVTSSRADWCHLEWPLRAMRDHPALDPRLLATGAHLAPEFGMTVREIARAGFEVDECIECLLSSDTDVAMAKTIGLATCSFADALGRRRPDLLLVMADRYEMLAPAAAAMALRIPIIHVEGGELSEGAIDQVVRNALTMMSHVHLVTTATAAARVESMGEEAWRIHRVGAGSLDQLRRAEMLSRGAVEMALDIDLSRTTAVVAHHPSTLTGKTLAESDALYAALERIDLQVVFTFPNADAGSRALIERARRYCADHPSARLRVNLEPRIYWSLLRQASIMIGNSSSGIMESTSLGLPAVDIGRRQAGRECAANIFHAEADAAAIAAAVGRALDAAFVDLVNPYGDGAAGARIASVLAELPDAETLLVKRARKPGRRGP